MENNYANDAKLNNEAATASSESNVRTKLRKRGPDALTDGELVAVILNVALERAERMVADVGAPMPGTDGMRLTALREYVKRGKPDPRPVIDCARAAVAHVPASVREARKEHFLCLVLNARRQLLHIETVSVGTLSASLVHPRECFFAGIMHSGAAIVVVHNHPSGDPVPSAEDREVTRRLQRAGELLGIPLADHVIVTTGGFFSFREHGLL